jgi:hypothetical protein
LEPGRVGNAFFGILFGLVLYQAVELGLVVVRQVTPEAWTLAFFLGVLGGFGGILVLERLIDRVLPGHGEGHEATRAPLHHSLPLRS